MGLELVILGVRKLNEEEIEELSYKSKEEMEESKFFRKFFPAAPYDSRYRCFWDHEIEGNELYKSIRPMLSPVFDDDCSELYVCWMEELGYYWHKNPHDRERIDRLFEDIGDIMNWDEEFHVVPYGVIDPFIDRRPSVMDPDEEIIAFLYG